MAPFTNRDLLWVEAVGGHQHGRKFDPVTARNPYGSQWRCHFRGGSAALQQQARKAENDDPLHGKRHSELIARWPAVARISGAGTAFTAGSGGSRDTGHMRLLLLPLLLLWCASAGAEVRVSEESARVVLQRVLDLVNDARASGHRCGRRNLPPVTPLTVSEPLARAAQQHAQDMARHGLLRSSRPGRQHTGGSRATRRLQPAPNRREHSLWSGIRGGSGARLAGKHRPLSENIMDARFAQVGIGLAEGSRRGHLYWVQNLGSPAHSALNAIPPARSCSSMKPAHWSFGVQSRFTSTQAVAGSSFMYTVR